MKKRKYAISWVILAISMLLALSLLSPSVAADLIKEGHMELTVYPDDTVSASAEGDDKEHDLISSPVTVEVTTRINDTVGQSYYYFYLKVTNLNTTEYDEDEDELGNQGGPLDIPGLMEATVAASVGNRLEVYIYCNVSHGGNSDDDNDTYIITLK